MQALSVHVCPRCLHHAARQYSLSSRIHSPCRRPKRIQSTLIAHSKGDGYHRAPFLEPAIATALTVVLIAGLAVSGIPQNLIDKAQGSKGGDTPFTDAKSITFGLLDGWAPAVGLAQLAECPCKCSRYNGTQAHVMRHDAV